ncbi:MAG: hypothetical protein KAX49_20870 [Halanaerobiales bacterium]|nr:hypothetical protein [Halanaerobiales bacterium]
MKKTIYLLILLCIFSSTGLATTLAEDIQSNTSVEIHTKQILEEYKAYSIDVNYPLPTLRLEVVDFLPF